MIKLTPRFFVTSDTHFGHTAMWELWGRTKNFEETIIERWNSVVTNEDSVLHLGDLTLCGKEQTIEFTQRLNGKKFLIRGNHDSNTVTWYKECGFIVLEPIVKRFRTKYGKYFTAIFSHEPFYDKPKNWFNIHGHLHSNSHRGIAPEGEYFFDAGVDGNDFTPVRLKQIFDFLNTENKNE